MDARVEWLMLVAPPADGDDGDAVEGGDVRAAVTAVVGALDVVVACALDVVVTEGADDATAVVAGDTPEVPTAALSSFEQALRPRSRLAPATTTTRRRTNGRGCARERGAASWAQAM